MLALAWHMLHDAAEKYGDGGGGVERGERSKIAYHCPSRCSTDILQAFLVAMET
jgi:hypothetical protein